MLIATSLVGLVGAAALYLPSAAAITLVAGLALVGVGARKFGGGFFDGKGQKSDLHSDGLDCGNEELYVDRASVSPQKSEPFFSNNNQNRYSISNSNSNSDSSDDDEKSPEFNSSILPGDSSQEIKIGGGSSFHR